MSLGLWRNVAAVAMVGALLACGDPRTSSRDANARDDPRLAPGLNAEEWIAEGTKRLEQLGHDKACFDATVEPWNPVAAYSKVPVDNFLPSVYFKPRCTGGYALRYTRRTSKLSWALSAAEPTAFQERAISLAFDAIDRELKLIDPKISLDRQGFWVVVEEDASSLQFEIWRKPKDPHVITIDTNARVILEKQSLQPQRVQLPRSPTSRWKESLIVAESGS